MLNLAFCDIISDMDNLKQKESIFSKKSVFAVCAILCTLLWGSAFPMVKKGYELFEITETGDKLMFAGMRFFIAGAILLLVTFFVCKNRGEKRPLRLDGAQLKVLLPLTAMQIVGNYFFYYIGLSNTAGSVASILNSLDIFLSVLIVPFFMKSDRLNVSKVFGILFGFAGVIIVNLGGSVSFSLFGEGFMLISGLFSTFGIILNKKATQIVSPIHASGFFLFTGGTVLMLVSLVMGGRLRFSNPSGIGVLFYLSGVSAIAFLLWSSLLKHNDVSKTGSFKLLIPVFGNILSALILGENIFSVSRIFAVLLVALGIWLVNRQDEKTKQ